MFIFLKSLYESMLRWMETSIDKIIVIIDEAHNLPDWRGAALRFNVSEFINRAVSEAKDYGYQLPNGEIQFNFLIL